MAPRKPGNRYAFHLRASYNDETALIVKQLTSLSRRKIGVFYQNDAYGKAGLDGGTLALPKLDLKPAPLSSGPRARQAMEARSTTYRSSEPKRWPTNRATSCCLSAKADALCQPESLFLASPRAATIAAWIRLILDG